MGKLTISMAIFNSYVWHNQRVMWNIFSMRHPPFGESIGSKSKRIRRILPFSIISPYTHRRRTYPEWHPPQKMTSLGPEMGYTPRCNGKGTLWLLNITMENGPFTMGLHWYIPCKSVMLYIVILSYIVLTPILQGYGLWISSSDSQHWIKHSNIVKYTYIYIYTISIYILYIYTHYIYYIIYMYYT